MKILGVIPARYASTRFEGKPLKDINGNLLIVSNFTIYGNTKKGRRPSYTNSAASNEAKKVYNLFLQKLKNTDIRFETGEFGEYMRIVSENDGPVNLILSSDL